MSERLPSSDRRASKLANFLLYAATVAVIGVPTAYVTVPAIADTIDRHTSCDYGPTLQPPAPSPSVVAAIIHAHGTSLPLEFGPDGTSINLDSRTITVKSADLEQTTEMWGRTITACRSEIPEYSIRVGTSLRANVILSDPECTADNELKLTVHTSLDGKAYSAELDTNQYCGHGINDPATIQSVELNGREYTINK